MIKLKHLINLISLLAVFIPVQGQTTDVPVTGIVIDANTADPIAGAVVIISTGFGQGIESDTLITDNNGEINDTISLDASAYGIAYSISASGYSDSYSYALVNNGAIDLGTIEVDKLNIPISFNSQIKADNSQTDQIQVFTLNGQMIYSGKTLDPVKIKNTAISVNQQLLIVNKYKGKILTVSKRQLFK